MKSFFLILSLIVVLTGCEKKIPMYRATLFNPTNYNVKILFYNGGVVSANDTIFLDSNTQFLLAYGPLGRGSSSGVGRGFNSDYNGDSIIVIFDDVYKMSHYIDPPLQLAKHYYLFESLRNIGNPYSYEYAVVKDDDGTPINDHKYYFTQQDYLDAKD